MPRTYYRGGQQHGAIRQRVDDIDLEVIALGSSLSSEQEAVNGKFTLLPTMRGPTAPPSAVTALG